MTKNELYHHGILGQKWGVRRYQNEDGSLTEDGRRRYANEGAVYPRKSESVRYRVSKSLGQTQKDLNEGGKIFKTSASDIRKVDNLIKNAKKKKAAANLDNEVKKLSDQELQTYIKRKNLENNYKNLKSQELNVKTGVTVVADYLDLIGDVIVVAGGAAFLANQIIGMKRGK